MINHARTLLLNRPASYFEGVPMSEYIPPTFRPITLPTGLQAFRDILFPPGIDKFSENYIAATLLQILHAPELEQYVTMYDPRFTYPIGDDVLRELITSPVVIRSDTDSTCDMVPKYRLLPVQVPRDTVLTGEHIWTFSTGTSTAANLVYSRKANTTETVELTTGGNTSKSVQLLGGYIQVYFGLPSTTLTGKYSFTYSALVPPPYELAVVNDAVQLYVVRPQSQAGLFAPGGAYATELEDLRFTWQTNQEVVLSLGTAIAGYLAQIEKLRGE